MKKLLIALLLFLSVDVAFSQKYEKKIAASDKSIEDPKKGINPKTWISRGELFYTIATAPIESLSIGMPEETYKIVMVGQEDTYAVQSETVNGKKYDVHVFDDKKVYFENAVIQFWDIFKYEIPNPMQKSYEAFVKAKSLDTEGKNAKKLKEHFSRLADQVRFAAYAKFYLNNYADAVELFTLAINSSDEAGIVDSVSFYHAGVIAILAKDYTIAEKYLRRAVEISYVDNGEAYASLAEALIGLEKADDALNVLEEGIVKFPENQRLMIALINSYRGAKKDPKKIIDLLQKAQEKDPGNTSLYIVEGDLYVELDDTASAKKSYAKSLEIDPNNFLGYYRIGILHSNTGAKYDGQALAEKDHNESNKLTNLAEEEFKKALPFLEKSFELNPEEISTIQLLKEINYRFRSQEGDDAKYKQNYEKYKQLLEEKGK